MVSLDLFIVRSWDGNNTTFGPDEWNLRVDGQPVFRTTFAFFDTFFNFRQAFPEAFPGGNFPGGPHLGRTAGPRKSIPWDTFSSASARRIRSTP